MHLQFSLLNKMKKEVSLCNKVPLEKKKDAKKKEVNKSFSGLTKKSFQLVYAAIELQQ